MLSACTCISSIKVNQSGKTCLCQPCRPESTRMVWEDGYTSAPQGLCQPCGLERTHVERRRRASVALATVVESWRGGMPAVSLICSSGPSWKEPAPKAGVSAEFRCACNTGPVPTGPAPGRYVCAVGWVCLERIVIRCALTPLCTCSAFP